MSDIPDVVVRYWVALADGDGNAMAECYAQDAAFKDEVFDLHGAEVGAMWRMLMGNATDLEVQAGQLHAVPGGAQGSFVATYTFTLTGRKVVNRIHSRFWVDDGLIIKQRDTFSFWRWSRMALGLRGTTLGWTPIVKSAVRKQARQRLGRFMQTEPTATIGRRS